MQKVTLVLLSVKMLKLQMMRKVPLLLVVMHSVKDLVNRTVLTQWLVVVPTQHLVKMGRIV